MPTQIHLSAWTPTCAFPRAGPAMDLGIVLMETMNPRSCAAMVLCAVMTIGGFPRLGNAINIRTALITLMKPAAVVLLSLSALVAESVSMSLLYVTNIITVGTGVTRRVVTVGLTSSLVSRTVTSEISA